VTASPADGAPARREDVRALTGATRFLDDISLPGTAEVAFVRSPHAHARIVSVRAPAPGASPGLVVVLTAASLAGRVRPFPAPAPEGAVLADERHPVLAGGEVRYVGQPVAMVVAATRAEAEDAAELVEVEYEPLPAVVDCRRSDLALMRWARTAGDVDGAFAAAAHVVRGRYALPRLAATPIECRGAIAVWDADGDLLTVWCSAQDPHRPLSQLGQILKRGPDRLRVVVPEVGGAFGSKGVVAPEVAALAAGAELVRRPLKWTEDRFENLLCAYQGRGIEGDLELALDSEGRMLGLRADLWADLGGYLLTTTAVPPHTCAMLITGAYEIPAAAVKVVGARTNKVPTGPYRGAGRPDAAYMLERLVDQAALELGVDRVQLRRRNLIRSWPHRTPLGFVYDSGDYERCMDQALALLGPVSAFPAPDAALGTGVGVYVERAGGQWESAVAGVAPDGRFEIRASSCPHGQGHDTTFAQIAAERLLVASDAVALRFGDSAESPPGVGTFGSRSVAVAGSAVALAADRLVLAGRRAAAAALGCDALEVVHVAGGFRRVWEAPGELPSPPADAPPHAPRLGRPGVGDRPTPGRGADQAVASADPGLISWAAVAPLRVEARFDSELVFSSGAHAAAVSIDRGTGSLSVLRIAAVDDAGTLISPRLAHGQVLGGVVQALGECLSEEVVHDDAGQNLSGSLLEYALPTAAEVPPIILGEVSSPSPHNPLGAKGAGEGGAVGALPAIANAVADALGGIHLDPPYTAQKLWRALHPEAEREPGAPEERR
jgi:aerobic carbon-monoxide dehydrogenase large subunit